ncbi:MAG: GtrA family protein [Oscillospiraceae bacterium]|jgi:putative flippase GtrA|nr:GtrA family protein [Oscillospiraceae bacterium]
MPEPVKLTRRENLILTVKYFLIAASAGAVEALAFALLSELVFHDSGTEYGWSYFIALMISIVWNFTLNRRYTFKSANNMPIAMLKVLGFYAVFTPASIWWGVALTALWPDSRLWYYGVFVFTLAVNGAAEFLFQRFVVYRKSTNTNELPQKSKGGR